MSGKGLQLKTTTLLVFFLWLVKSFFEKLVNNGIVDHLGKCGLFSVFQNGFRSSQSTADLLTVVSDRIARAFNRSGATRAMALDISKVFAGFRMVVYFTNLGLGEFQVRYLALFLLFSVVDGCEWFWMESLHRSIQLVLEFLKGPLLVRHFSSCILMTFLMVLSVVLVSMQMILLFIVGVIRHLICDGSSSLNLIYGALWTGVGSGLLISMLGKLSWFHLTSLITIVLLM